MEKYLMTETLPSVKVIISLKFGNKTFYTTFNQHNNFNITQQEYHSQTMINIKETFMILAEITFLL